MNKKRVLFLCTGNSARSQIVGGTVNIQQRVPAYLE